MSRFRVLAIEKTNCFPLSGSFLTNCLWRDGCLTGISPLLSQEPFKRRCRFGFPPSEAKGRDFIIRWHIKMHIKKSPFSSFYPLTSVRKISLSAICLFCWDPLKSAYSRVIELYCGVKDDFYKGWLNCASVLFDVQMKSSFTSRNQPG